MFLLAGRTAPAEVVVIGVEPARIEWGAEFTPKVQDALPGAVPAVRAIAASRGE